MPLSTTELRQRNAPLSKPLPRFLLRTFEAYLPPMLGVDEPRFEPLVAAATRRFDAYVQAIPPWEPARDDLMSLLALLYAWGRWHGRGRAPWKQSPAERERFVREVLFRTEGRPIDRLLDTAARILGRLSPNGSFKRATVQDLVRSMRELMSLAFYTAHATDELVTGYQRIWDRSYPGRTDIDLGRLRAERRSDEISARRAAAVFQQGHPYDVPRLFRNDGRPKVAIIGSGAGGAVVAARLAATKKFDVVVFEAGPRIQPTQYPLDTFVGMAQLFESGLMTLSRDLDIHLLRGRVVGGGTVMTSGLSVKMRNGTRDQWCATSGELSIGVTAEELERGFDAVAKRQHMCSMKELDPQLETDASRKMGIALDKTADWVESDDVAFNNVVMREGQAPGGRPDQNGAWCFGCGMCNYGCHFGHKLSMDVTYLRDAERDGARIAQNVPVERLDGRPDASGAMKVDRLILGRGLGHVDVDHVVLAGGAVGTPALLLRSADADRRWRKDPSFRKHVGEGLGFNYGSGVVARWTPCDAEAQATRAAASGPYPAIFERPGHLGFQIKFIGAKAGDPELDVRVGPPARFTSRGVPIPPKPEEEARYAKHFARYVVENAFLPPGLLSNVVPGVGRAHLDWMRDYRNLAMCATTIGGPQTGRVLADRTVVYKLSHDEIRLNREALAEVVRLYLNAGAAEVGLAGVREDPDPSQTVARVGQGLLLTREKFAGSSAKEIADRLERVLYRPEHIMLSSAHPQGGCRMSVDPERGAVDERFRLRCASNVFVMDASLFPSTIVVNPQWTIAALAEVAGERIAREVQAA